MAFINTSDVDLGRMKGYSRYLEEGLSALNLTGNESIGRELLNVLRENFLSAA